MFQRPFTPEHVTILNRFKEESVPTWIEYDDLLTAIPKHNPSFDTYGKPDILEALKIIPALVDIITVTTPYLKECLQSPSVKDVRVVPNAWDDYHLPMEQEKHAVNKSLRIVWRGSPTHISDLDLYADPVIRLHKEDPSIHWFFLGFRPWFTRQMEQTHCHVFEKPLDMVEYIRFLGTIRPDILVVPLTDDPFNRAKSNIAWMEASFADAVTVAPDFPEWNRPGIINYKDSILDTLSDTIVNIDSLKHNTKLSWDFIQENLLLSKVNYLRWEVLEEIISKKKPITTSFLPLGSRP
jgi:hypothetical protein